jgi:hypothetical protein
MCDAIARGDGMWEKCLNKKKNADPRMQRANMIQEEQKQRKLCGK